MVRGLELLSYKDKTGCKRWDCLAWRREGSGDTSLQPSST